MLFLRVTYIYHPWLTETPASVGSQEVSDEMQQRVEFGDNPLLMASLPGTKRVQEFRISTGLMALKIFLLGASLENDCCNRLSKQKLLHFI